MTFILALAALLTLGFAGAKLFLWFLTAGAFLFLLDVGTISWIIFGILAIIFLTPLRAQLLTRPLMGWIKKAGIMPKISDTEREALEAGTVWIEGELFSGRPNFQTILDEPWPELSAEERTFLDGPAEEVCRMTDDWQVFQKRDLPPSVWKYLADNGFFGLIIPKTFGGLEFSPQAVSAIIAKLSSRSVPLGITAMLPNSLGPAELLVHYGTSEQKLHWLPKLATGEELPCFALTEPEAGSDAGSLKASGRVFRGEDGEPWLRLNWEKRYITLAVKATVLGLAFKVEDPDGLLGLGPAPGITCALVPAESKGVTRGKQHDPLNVPFFNCPFEGKDVEIPVSAIIGGKGGVGKGWRMLMECLAAGRGIMLPAQGIALTKMAARAVGAYSVIRKQFGLSIGKFEGIEEGLARIAGHAYILDSAGKFIAGALDRGVKPAVVSAIAKYQFTEILRKTLIDAMDIQGGAAISRGPRNLLAHAWFSAPISITVEGANILTRTLMVFGQGAIRCHPWAYREIVSLQTGDVGGFDKAFFGHIGHMVRNTSRALLLSLTRGRLADVPGKGEERSWWQRMAWSSATFATTADIAMGMYGGDLKRKEAVTGRLADILSWMLLGTSVLRRWQEDGKPKEDLAYVRWTMEHALGQIQTGFDGVFRNLDVPILGKLFQGPVAFWSRLNSISPGPTDEQGSKLAALLRKPSAQRDRLFSDIYVPNDPEEAIGRLEHVFRLCAKSDATATRMRTAMKEGRLPKGDLVDSLGKAVKSGILTEVEAEEFRHAEAARRDAIDVDAFDEADYLATAVDGGWGAND